MRVWIAVWVGSSKISHAVVRWLLGGVVLRLIVVAVAAGFVKGLAYTTAILVTLAAVWLAVAVVLGLRAPDPTKPAVKPELLGDGDARPQEDPGEPPAKGPTRGEVADLLRGLLGERGGVHLSDLAKALPGPRRATRDVRSLLASMGIRVRAGVRAPGKGVREGVHRDDIPAPSSPASETTPVADVAAGQGNNNNGNNTEAIVRDPTHPSRWLVRRDH